MTEPRAPAAPHAAVHADRPIAPEPAIARAQARAEAIGGASSNETPSEGAHPPIAPEPAIAGAKAPAKTLRDASSIEASSRAFDATEPAAPAAVGQADSARPAVGRAATRLVAVASIATIAGLLVLLATYGYGRDQGIYAMVARTLEQGGMPYRDAWDFKPPGIFLVYAAARSLFGPSQASIRFLEAIGLAGTVVVLARLARAWWGKPAIGLLAGALAVLAHAQLDFWHTAQPESFGGMLTMAALLLGTRSARDPARPDRRTVAAWLAAGALFGAAGLLKPPLAGGAAVLAAHHAHRAFVALRRASPHAAPLRAAVRPAAVPTLLLATGGALPNAACLAWFAARGALPDLVDTLFVFTPHYTKLGWEGSSLGGMIWWGITEWLVRYCSVLTVGLALLLGFGARPHERPGVLVLVGVVAMHVTGVVMQGKFFPYHYGATWLPTAMLAALGYFRLIERAARLGAAGAALVLGLAALTAFGRTATKDTPDSFLERSQKRVRLLAGGLRDRATLDALASVADVNATANRAVAEWLRERVPPDRPVFVWGFEPVIYDLADRRPATRFLYDVPQRVPWAKARMRAALLRDLAERPPAAIVVEHRDVFPMVTGDALDSAASLDDFPELRALLDDRYELAHTIEDFDLYLERP